MRGRVVGIPRDAQRGRPASADSDESARSAGPVAPARRTDELDRRIIEALQANGRESFRAIAARVGVSEATVRARYGRLTAEGILQVVAVTNPLGLGYEQALVGVKTLRLARSRRPTRSRAGPRPTTSSPRQGSSTSSSNSLLPTGVICSS